LNYSPCRHNLDEKNIQQKLAVIRQSYLASLGEKQLAITECWQTLKQGWDQKTLDDLYLIMHGLAGSAETFGLPEVTQNARIIVNRLRPLKSGKLPDTRDLTQLEIELEQFGKQLAAIKQ